MPKKNYIKRFRLLLICIALVCVPAGGCKKAVPEKSGTEKTDAKKADTEEKLEGMLIKFTGSEIAVEDDTGEYLFDVSQAVIKTKNMRSRDDVIVSYEGKLEGTDTGEPARRAAPANNRHSY